MTPTSMFRACCRRSHRHSPGKKIEAAYRQKLLDNVLPYIESGNAGLDDDLYDVAYAACYTNDDWLALAEAFETMGGDWKLDHTRRNYRRPGDRDKYLELRQRKLATGTDYFDLADFHWKAGEKQKAIEVAKVVFRPFSVKLTRQQ